MESFTYKGYKSDIHYEKESALYYLSIEGISDYVVIAVEDKSLIEERFIAVVDEYLKACRLMGKIPERPLEGVIEVSIGFKDHKILYEEAKRKKINLQELISNILSQYADFIR